MGLNDRDIYELFDGNKSAKELRSITPGQKFEFLVDTQGKLQELKYFKNNLDSLKFTRNDNGFTSKQTSLKPEVKRSFRKGTINSSLFLAGKQAGLPNNLTMELANIFGYDVDFALDIQKGDTFKVMFEEQYLNGTGAILSAEFTNEGKTYRAVRYTNKDGITRYYAPDGKGLNKAFLRTPVDFARISSGFSLGRLHPVLNTIRAHKGTDYAASTGTPIRSTGDGKITFAGRQGGFGNCIVIQHGQGYETLYGHMSKFGKGISTGTRVSQGQVIGYVGMTGLASGPHLHYEFHVNGQVRNPVTVELPKSVGIAANEKDSFNSATQTLVAQLQDFENSSRLAMGESQTKSN
jgi:murein DD-endopeptidase MepM/ murein hydrolase activator NlpD